MDSMQGEKLGDPAVMSYEAQEALQDVIPQEEDRLRPFWVRSMDGESFIAQPHMLQKALLLPGFYELGMNQMGQLVMSALRLRADQLYNFSSGPMPEILGEVEKFWKAAPLYERLGITHKRSVLFEGPPGCGKSCTIQQVIEKITEMKGIALNINNVRAFPSYFTEFRKLEPTVPVVGIIEDVDNHATGGSETYLLNLLDSAQGFGGNILYLMTSNHPERIPARLKSRPSRISKVIHVGYPTPAQLIEYGLKVVEGLGMDEIVHECVAHMPANQFSYDDLKEAITSVYVLEEKPKDIVTRLSQAKGLHAAPSDDASPQLGDDDEDEQD